MSRKNPTPVNIRNFSVKCGNCGNYPALAIYEPGDEFNTYRFECDDPGEGGEACRQIILEIHTDLDEFANRDPKWGGGKVHAGPEAGEEAEAPAQEDESAAGEIEAEAPGGLLPVISD